MLFSSINITFSSACSYSMNKIVF